MGLHYPDAGRTEFDTPTRVQACSMSAATAVVLGVRPPDTSTTQPAVRLTTDGGTSFGTPSARPARHPGPYLMTPISPDSLLTALDEARARGASPHELEPLMDLLEAPSRPEDSVHLSSFFDHYPTD